MRENDGLRREYDFSGGVRGKYVERFGASTVVVVLDPDVSAVFPDSEAVNSALRDYAGIGRGLRKKVPKSRAR